MLYMEVMCGGNSRRLFFHIRDGERSRGDVDEAEDKLGVIGMVRRCELHHESAADVLRRHECGDRKASHGITGCKRQYGLERRRGLVRPRLVNDLAAEGERDRVGSRVDHFDDEIEAIRSGYPPIAGAAPDVVDRGANLGGNSARAARRLEPRASELEPRRNSLRR